MRVIFVQTFLITGGAGFIGSNFIHYLFSKYPYIRIINIDKLTYASNLRNLNGVSHKPNYIFIKEDICCQKSIYEIFENYKPNYVVNFAAESHVDRSILSPEIFAKINILGTEILLQASLKYGIKKFLQISTDEVYGSIKNGFFNESSMLMPSNPYAATKASADLLVQAFNKTYELPTLITRSANNYGPRQYPEKLIPLAIKNCLNYSPVPLYGDGTNVRDWLYVYDNCSAIDRVLSCGIPGEIYNISANMEKKNTEIVNLIIETLNTITLDPNINRSLIKFVADRKSHDERYGIDATKIKTQLNWNPSYDFYNSFKETVKWYIKYLKSAN